MEWTPPKICSEHAACAADAPLKPKRPAPEPMEEFEHKQDIYEHLLDLSTPANTLFEELEILSSAAEEFAKRLDNLCAKIQILRCQKCNGSIESIPVSVFANVE